MPRRKKDEDFNTQIHALYVRIAGGESSHDDEPPAPSAEPPPAEEPKKPEKVFDPNVNPAHSASAAARRAARLAPTA